MEVTKTNTFFLAIYSTFTKSQFDRLFFAFAWVKFSKKIYFLPQNGYLYFHASKENKTQSIVKSCEISFSQDFYILTWPEHQRGRRYFLETGQDCTTLCFNLLQLRADTFAGPQIMRYLKKEKSYFGFILFLDMALPIVRCIIWKFVYKATSQNKLVRKQQKARKFQTICSNFFSGTYVAHVVC